jgi:hypothetical protein
MKNNMTSQNKRRPRRRSPLQLVAMSTIAFLTAAMMASGGIAALGGRNFMFGCTVSGYRRCAYEPVLIYAMALIEASRVDPAPLPVPEPPQELLPLSQQWMTPELIAETQAVWSPCEGRMLTVAEAVEILGNVKQYVEVMLRIEDEINAEKKGLA